MRSPSRLQALPAAACVLAAAAMVLLRPSPALAAAKPKPAGPKTYTVRKEVRRVDVKLSGVFEAKQMAEVSISPEAWTQLRVVEAVEHGKAVKKGGVLVRLDRKKIDKALADKAEALKLGELALKQAAEELRHLAATTPDQLAQATRARKRADEDLAQFTKVGRPLAKKQADSALKHRGDVLEYVKEELRQLLKMYKADDLTEETEEIVLKRQRDAVQRSELALEKEKIAHEWALKVTLPRQAEDATSAMKAKDEDKKTKDVLLPVALSKKRLEAAKLKADHALARKALDDLRKDREAMTIRSPIDGMVYYGRCVRGKWTTGATVAPKLAPGGTIAADQVILTVVSPKELLVRAAVPEGELHHLRKGLSGVATATGYPKRKMKVSLASHSAVPLATGGFDATFTVAGNPAPVMPGMTGSIVLAAQEAKGVLTVPAAAVRTDPANPKEHFVYLKTPGKPQRRVVKVGPTHGGKTEIREGLAAGEVIFLEAPK